MIDDHFEKSFLLLNLMMRKFFTFLIPTEDSFNWRIKFFLSLKLVKY